MNKNVQVVIDKVRSNPKPYIYGTAAVIAGIFVILFIRRIIRNKKVFGIADMGDELSQLDTNRTTLTSGEATVIAQNLLNAMDKIGTDEDAIYDNLGRAKTAADLYYIIQKFGVKLYDGWGLADTFLSIHIGSTMKNLNGWLRAELKGRKLDKVKGIYDNLGVPF